MTDESNPTRANDDFIPRSSFGGQDHRDAQITVASNRMSISQSDFAVHFASSRALQSWTAHRKRKQDLEREGVQADALRKSDLGHVGRVIKNFKYL